jgi:hypothetical protein
METDAKVSEHEAKAHFNKTLFIIKYNWNAPLNKLFLHSQLWGKIFQHQLIVVPYDSKTLQLAKEKVENTVDLISCKDIDDAGYFAYTSIIIGIDKHPQYDGYLYAHDDMAMNVSNLILLDINSFWGTFSEKEFGSSILDDTWGHRNHSWPWWNSHYGIDAMQNTINSYPTICQSLKRCTGTTRRWFKGPSDFLYVPKQYALLYMDIMGKFQSKNVFLEIAVPTFMQCFVPKNLVENIALCQFWDHHRNNVSHMRVGCDPLSSAFHPVKISSHNALEFMVDKMDVTFQSPISLMF